MCLPFIVYWLITSLAMMLDGVFELKPLSFDIIKTSLIAGVSEEVGFRNGIISTMLRNRNSKDQLVKVCLAGSLIFGLIHLLNLSGGADLLHTVIQIFTVSGHGVFFGALFISCGNLLPCIIIHMIHDIIAIATTAAVSESGIITGAVGFSDIIDLLACVGMGVYALMFYLKADQRDRIVRLWNDKWSKAEFQKTE